MQPAIHTGPGWERFGAEVRRRLRIDWTPEDDHDPLVRWRHEHYHRVRNQLLVGLELARLARKPWEGR